MEIIMYFFSLAQNKLQFILLTHAWTLRFTVASLVSLTKVDLVYFEFNLITKAKNLEFSSFQQPDKFLTRKQKHQNFTAS